MGARSNKRWTPTSRIRAPRDFDSVLLAFDYRDLHLDTAAADPDDATTNVDERLLLSPSGCREPPAVIVLGRFCCRRSFRRSSRSMAVSTRPSLAVPTPWCRP